MNKDDFSGIMTELILLHVEEVKNIIIEYSQKENLDVKNFTQSLNDIYDNHKMRCILFIKSLLIEDIE